MADIITNLHPDGDESTNLYPNIKKENIPSKSISTDKLDDNVLSLIGSLKPSGTDTSTNILAYTSNKGIYVATDNGYWYYWNGSQYVDGGVYQSSEDIEKIKEELNQGFMQGVLPLSEYNNPSLWELGGIGSDGQNINDSKRCRLIKSHAMYAQDDCVIKTSVSDFLLFVFQYGDSDCTDYKGELGYIGSGKLSLTLPKGYYYRFRSQANPVVSIDSTVIATLATKFSVVSNTLVSEHEERITVLETTATTHSASISDLENKYYWEYGINRNPNNYEEGFIDSDGSIKTGSGYWHTDYCYVGDLDKVICSCNAVGGTMRYAQHMAFLSTYDENKNFIERVYTTGSSTYTVEDGVAFVRFCIQPSSIENVMLQGGDVFAKSFIPYVAPQQKLKPQYYNSGSNWSDKKWVVVGDSITEYNSKANKHYHDYVNEATGINVVNMGSSGTGYKRTEDESKAFYQRILNVPTNADVVTIFGSGNDLNYSAMGFSTFAEALGSPTDSGTSTICGCINQTIANLYSIMPTVQLGIVTPNPWETMNPANVGNDMDLYSNAIIEICKLHGIPCLDLYHCSNMRPWDATYRTLCYSNDGGYGVHPNDLGHKILASHFKAFLDTLLI